MFQANLRKKRLILPVVFITILASGTRQSAEYPAAGK